MVVRMECLWQGVADTMISPNSSIDERLAKMQRALVAHDALVAMLSLTGADPGVWQSSLVSAIGKAVNDGLVTFHGGRYLRYFNSEANAAKHDRMLPF
jgi:hypothetical protein